MPPPQGLARLRKIARRRLVGLLGDGLGEGGTEGGGGGQRVSFRPSRFENKMTRLLSEN